MQSHHLHGLPIIGNLSEAESMPLECPLSNCPNYNNREVLK